MFPGPRSRVLDSCPSEMRSWSRLGETSTDLPVPTDCSPPALVIRETASAESPKAEASSTPCTPRSVDRVYVVQDR